MRLNDTMTTVQGKPISAEDVVNHLKVGGFFRKAIYQLIEREVIQIQARVLGIALSDEEIQRCLDEKRRDMGLSDAVRMSRYCRAHGIHWEQWKETVVVERLRDTLKRQIIRPEEITAHFEKIKNSLKTVSLARIVFSEKSRALRIQQELLEGRHIFSAYARKHSTEEATRSSGGYLGNFSQNTLPKEIKRFVVDAKPGQVVGPCFQNGLWVLYRIEKWMSQTLDDAMRQQIHHQLFEAWLHREMEHLRA